MIVYSMKVCSENKQSILGTVLFIIRERLEEIKKELELKNCSFKPNVTNKEN